MVHFGPNHPPSVGRPGRLDCHQAGILYYQINPVGTIPVDDEDGRVCLGNQQEPRTRDWRAGGCLLSGFSIASCGQNQDQSQGGQRSDPHERIVLAFWPSLGDEPRML